MFKSTKTYGSDRGFSVALRNHRARNDNCELLHGYSLGFKFVFASPTLDARGWVVDFGGLRTLKEELEHNFDHTTLIAEDDPELETFKLLHDKKALKLNVLRGVSCEELAEQVFNLTRFWLDTNGYKHVTLESVEVFEHGANSALFYNSSK
jgi:6-pyruvoyltetrahydropterin/6-carboxytetrahydropterin synthase